MTAAAQSAQITPLLEQVEEALRRSHELLSLPIYPHDPMPSR